ncbi:hypothetical protein MRB53_040905 [Persea americana]|nr:hypothetical protein MRB53_040905 [Persea americana]
MKKSSTSLLFCMIRVLSAMPTQLTNPAFTSDGACRHWAFTARNLSGLSAKYFESDRAVFDVSIETDILFDCIDTRYREPRFLPSAPREFRMTCSPELQLGRELIMGSTVLQDLPILAPRRGRAARGPNNFFGERQKGVCRFLVRAEEEAMFAQPSHMWVQGLFDQQPVQFLKLFVYEEAMVQRFRHDDAGLRGAPNGDSKSYCSSITASPVAEELFSTALDASLSEASLD